MHIVIVTSWPTDVIGGSGTAVFFNTFLVVLKDLGHQVEVIAPNFDISDYVEATLKRFLFNTELRTDPRVAAADVVIGFDYDGYGLDPARRPPMLTSVHAIFGDVIRWESEPVRTMVQAQAFFDQVSMQQADHLAVGSEYAKDRVIQLYGIPAEKISVIYHAMTEPTWYRLVNAEPRIPNDHPVILSVGKMYPRKQTNILLHALSRLITKYPSIELRIVGSGLEWDRLHNLADELAIQNNVTWLSSIADDAAFAREWRQADIFCHPSCQETFGFVYLEAMMLGKPIVAARAGAAPEVIDDAGLLVEPENPDTLAAGIEQFLDNEGMCIEYGERAKQQATQFNLDRMRQGYAQVLSLTIHKYAAMR
jgi:glycosyltransferase involved in cell wall biosynthesis